MSENQAPTKNPRLIEIVKRRRREEAESMVSGAAQYLCGNAILSIELLSDNPDQLEFRYGAKNDGCKNPRRQKSKFCQECSDKHNGIEAPLPTN